MKTLPETAICTPEEHEGLLRHVRLGQLFELTEWVDAGKPTLCPDFDKPRTRQSPICEALDRGNKSMVRFLWERAGCGTGRVPETIKAKREALDAASGIIPAAAGGTNGLVTFPFARWHVLELPRHRPGPSARQEDGMHPECRLQAGTLPATSPYGTWPAT